MEAEDKLKLVKLFGQDSYMQMKEFVNLHIHSFDPSDIEIFMTGINLNVLGEDLNLIRMVMSRVETMPEVVWNLRTAMKIDIMRNAVKLKDEEFTMAKRKIEDGW